MLCLRGTLPTPSPVPFHAICLIRSGVTPSASFVSILSLLFPAGFDILISYPGVENGHRTFLKQIEVSVARAVETPKRARAISFLFLLYTARAYAPVGHHILLLTVPHVRHPTTSRWYKAPGEQRFAGTVEWVDTLINLSFLFFFTFQAPASGVHSEFREAKHQSSIPATRGLCALALRTPGFKAGLLQYWSDLQPLRIIDPLLASFGDIHAPGHTGRPASELKGTDVRDFRQIRSARQSGAARGITGKGGTPGPNMETSLRV
ncbi:hypothetical protein BC826DRAFT_972607 [Russula brevipes]|nr:hypothetical protein BC826DRAFT_972607 [Russula brevipes]